MATDQRNLPSFFSNSTDFQNWYNGIIAQLTAVGMVQTADTGQIGASAAQPGTINTTAGYAIFRFNDALQSGTGSLPVFVKVEFGVGGAVDRPSIWFTVGTGTNGAGTLTGQVGTRAQRQTVSSTTAGSTAPSYCCYDTTGGFALASNVVAGSITSCLIAGVIDRSRDGAGTATADGVLTWYGGNNAATATAQVIPAAPTTVPASASSFGSLGGGATGVVSPVGGNVVVIPIFWGLGKLFMTKMLHVAKASDLSSGTAVSVNTLGGTHTYMPVTPSQSPADLQSGAIALFLWE